MAKYEYVSCNNLEMKVYIVCYDIGQFMWNGQFYENESYTAYINLN